MAVILKVLGGGGCPWMWGDEGGRHSSPGVVLSIQSFRRGLRNQWWLCPASQQQHEETRLYRSCRPPQGPRIAPAHGRGAKAESSGMKISCSTGVNQLTGDWSHEPQFLKAKGTEKSNSKYFRYNLKTKAHLKSEFIIILWKSQMYFKYILQ